MKVVLQKILGTWRLLRRGYYSPIIRGRPLWHCGLKLPGRALMIVQPVGLETGYVTLRPLWATNRGG